MLRLGDADQQRAQRRELHPPGPGRRLAGRRQVDRVHVEVEQLAAKLEGRLGDLLGVGVGSQLDLDPERRWTLLHAHPSSSTTSTGEPCDT